jgi:hypothetical protein
MNTWNKIKSGLVAGSTLLLLSCNSWLEVEPEDKIMSDLLFKERSGFLSALNGVYAELNAPALYGENLTMGAIDVMGQYYHCLGVSNHRFLNFPRGALYFQLPEPKAELENIWKSAYKTINDCNILIEQCGDGNPVLPDEYYRLIKGETLALRAWLHFDLLRLFGPVWSRKTEPAIPYVATSARVVQPILSGEEVLRNVIDDLIAASDLLATIDPVLTEGAKNYAGAEVSNGNDWNYRQSRLNCLAARTLLARAYLWSGDKAKAGETARDVIGRGNNPENPLFPLTRPGITANTDRIFSKEVLFALHNTSRTEKVYNTLFSSDLALNRILAAVGDVSTGRVAYIYDDISDYRFQMWEPRVVSGASVTCLLKYSDVANDSLRYMIPLVRLSEAYLIAAECEENVQTALDSYLNPLRLARNCRDFTASSMEEVTELVAAEYAREFAGEGQLYYLFKRREQLIIPEGALPNYMKAFTLDDYKLPLPDSEVNLRTE